MAEGGVCEMLNIIDDHSRVCVESRAFVTTRSPDVVRALHRAADKWSPMSRDITAWALQDLNL